MEQAARWGRMTDAAVQRKDKKHVPRVVTLDGSLIDFGIPPAISIATSLFGRTRQSSAIGGCSLRRPRATKCGSGTGRAGVSYSRSVARRGRCWISTSAFIASQQIPRTTCAEMKSCGRCTARYTASLLSTNQTSAGSVHMDLDQGCSTRKPSRAFGRTRKVLCGAGIGLLAAGLRGRGSWPRGRAGAVVRRAVSAMAGGGDAA